jgi:hypothetical protein
VVVDVDDFHSFILRVADCCRLQFTEPHMR